MKQTIRKVLTRKYLVISVAALLLYALVGFVIAPLVIRWYVPQYAQQNLHCQAGVEKIRINPFLFSLEIDRFSLRQADGSPLLAFERFFVDLEMSSLFHWAVVLRELDLDKPEIHLVIEPDGSINFEKLATAPPQTAEPAPAEAKPFPFILQDATLRGGRIAVADKRQSTPANFTLQGLNLDLKQLATVKDQNGTYHLAATTEAGESLQWEGEVTLSPLRSKGKLSLNAIRIASLWQFFRDSTNLEQPAGQINVATEYRLSAENTPLQMTLEGLRFSSADLSLKLLGTDKALLQLKKMDLDVPRFDLVTKEVHVGRLLLEEGAVDARINDSGGINLQQIIRASPPEKHPQKEPPPPVAPPATSGSRTRTKDRRSSTSRSRSSLQSASRRH